jgi:alanine-glyoxylate transaminase/serine-glyoxylate transaminase/serine-pyruvate transaminase
MPDYRDEPMMEELKAPPRILLGPGPSGVHPRVLSVMTTPMLGYLDDAFLRIMDDTVELLRRVFQTQNRLTLAVSGTGTAGMEAALCNVLEPDDHAIVGVNGYFGHRLADIAARCGARVTRVDAPWGEIVPADKIAAALNKGRTKLVAVVHAETSTGVLQPLEDIAALAREHDALMLADCVTSLGGAPVDLDARGVDIAYSATQKCLGGPPGLAPVSFSARAVDAIRGRRQKVQSFYLDMTLLERYWFGEAREYHHTISMTLVYALHEALRVILEEGLAARWRRHERHAQALAAGVAALGLKLGVQAGHRAPMLTTVLIPEGVDDARVRAGLLNEYSIEIGGGLGAFKGKAWRIGLMGEAATQQNVLLVLSALESLLARVGHAAEPGAAVAAASRHYISE